MSLGRLVKQALGWALPGVVLYRGAPGKAPRLALTFDDGPHPGHTERILEALAREGACATFFLQGSEAAKHPALVRAIHEAGHQIGNHGYSHGTPAQLGRRAFVREVVETQDLLEAAAGARLERLFRPPYGTLSLGSFVALVRRGFRFVFWSLDSEDSFIREAGQLQEHLLSGPLRSGDVLLFHEDYAHTIEALPAILSALKARSFQLARIADL